MGNNCEKRWAISRVSEIFARYGNNLNLTATQRLVILGLAHYADSDGSNSFPTFEQLANFTGLKVNAIKMAMTAKETEKRLQSKRLKELQSQSKQKKKTRVSKNTKTLLDLKIISYKRKYDGDRKMTRNFYTLNIDLLLTIAVDAKGKVLDIKAQAQTVSNPQHLGSENCANIEPSIPNILRSKIDPSIPEILDPSIPEILGSPYILPIQKAPTHNTSKSKDIVQLDKNLTKIPVSSFDEFWAAYPRKENRLKAMKTWQSHGLDEKADVIIEDVIRRAMFHKQWKTKEFIPMATTYLNGERWNDEIICEENEIAKTNNEASKPVSSRRVDKMQSAIEQYERKHGKLFGGNNGA